MGLHGTDFTALREPLSPEDVSIQGATARRAYHGPWDQRWDFARAVLGRETIVPGPPIAIALDSPITYPGQDHLHAVRVAMSGDGASFEDPERPFEIAYDHAIVEVSFEAITWEANEEEFITVDLDGASEFTTIEGGSVFSSGHVVPGLTAILVPQIDFAIEFHKLPDVPWHWFDHVGHTNLNPWRDIAAGRLLFLPTSVRGQRNASGNRRYQGRAAFSYRRIPWNHAWNPYTGTFQLVASLVTGLPHYPESDYSLLASG